MRVVILTPPAELIYEAIGLKKQFDNGKVIALRSLDLKNQLREFVAIVWQSDCPAPRTRRAKVC